MYGRVHRMKRMVKQVENEETRKKKKDAEKRKRKKTYGTRRRTLRSSKKELSERGGQTLTSSSQSYQNVSSVGQYLFRI